MSTALIILLAIAVLGVAFYLRLRYAVKRSIKRIKLPPAVIDEGSVQCFSCGMVVPIDKALEKKGRYFCGVKRNDRDGNPIERETAGEKTGLRPGKLS